VAYSFSPFAVIIAVAGILELQKLSLICDAQVVEIFIFSLVYLE
jgi:hypothetical protein